MYTGVTETTRAAPSRSTGSGTWDRPAGWRPMGKGVRRMDLVAREDGTLAGSRLGWLWLLLPIIFLPNLAQPISDLFRGHPTPLRLGLVLAGVTLFIALYLWTSLMNDVSRPNYPAIAPARSIVWLWGQSSGSWA